MAVDRLLGIRPAARGYMHTPEIPLHVRPALSHSLFVVYDRGEAPGYDVACDSWLAHPATKATRAKTTARVFMSFPPG
jgi:hypothetical protein